MKRRARLTALFAAAACAAALLVACGEDDASTTSVAATTEATTTAETVTEETTTEETTTAPTTQDGEPPAADTAVTELTSFSSPTGNIGCLIEPLEVRCDIAERDWEPPPAPADCDLDYGQGVMLITGSTADLVCAGDTALNATTSGAPLPYGQSIAAGLLRCESRRSGMRCLDTETGRGFKLSRESYELF